MTSQCVSDGKKVSLLGYGAMRLPTVDGGHSNTWQKEGYSKDGIDQELLNAQVKTMLDGGLNYFDTSPAYCRGESERRLGEALEKSGYPRDGYVVATKLSNFAPQQQSAEASRKMFEDSFKLLRTDYIDNYLLHSVGGGGVEAFNKRFVENGMLDFLLEARKARRIRNLGFSFHGDKATFDWCLAQHGKYHWDFVMIQMNFIDWRHPGRGSLTAEYQYTELAKRGIPVVIMEPLRGGTLARYNHAIARELTPLDPGATQAKWAFRFCASHPAVMTVISGMTRTEHIEEDLAIFSPLKPCTDDEFAALERAAEAFLKCGTVPCTDCMYCMPCPYGLDIPALLRFRNDFLTKETGLPARELLAAYAKAVPEELRRADHCTGCGRCRPHCPQQIDIPDEIAAIDHVIDLLKDEEVKRRCH